MAIKKRTSQSVGMSCGWRIFSAATVRVKKILDSIVDHFLRIVQVKRFTRNATTWTGRRQ